MLEGLLATVVLAIILVGAAPFFYVGRSLIYRSRLKRQAVELVTDHVESLIDLGFDQISDHEQDLELDGLPATLTADVENAVIDPDGNGYKQVTVAIRWTHGGKDKEVTVVTYISKFSWVH